MRGPNRQAENIHNSGEKIDMIFYNKGLIKLIFNLNNFYKLSKACRGLQNIDQTKALDDRSQNAVRVAHSVRNFMFFENKIQVEIIKVINN